MLEFIKLVFYIAEDGVFKYQEYNI